MHEGTIVRGNKFARGDKISQEDKIARKRISTKDQLCLRVKKIYIKNRKTRW